MCKNSDYILIVKLFKIENHKKLPSTLKTARKTGGLENTNNLFAGRKQVERRKETTCLQEGNKRFAAYRLPEIWFSPPYFRDIPTGTLLQKRYLCTQDKIKKLLNPLKTIRL